MRSLRSGRKRVSRGLGGAALASTCVLAAACGSATPKTFHPAGGTAASPPASAQASGSATSTQLAVPPFGQNAHVAMTSWLPANSSEIPAVITAKDFLLAVLYADYTGNRDHRWTTYVAAGPARTGLARSLAVPGVTHESFTGTIRLWRMHALATSGAKGSVEVTECVDSARVRNTGRRSGKVLPKRLQNTTDQNYYLNSDVLAKNTAGNWRIISISPAIYYPEAQECKP